MTHANVIDILYLLNNLLSKYYMEPEQINQRVSELEQVLHQMKRNKMDFPPCGGLKKSEIFVLRQIHRLTKDQPVMPSELAKVGDVTLAAITHHLNSLEEAGFIVRESSTDDRRNIYIKLSDQGKELADTLEKAFKEKITGMVEFLGDADAEELIRLVNKIAIYLQNDKQEESNV